MEKTLVLIKPDAVERNIIGEILSIYERHRLKVVALKMLKVDMKTAKSHYNDHEDKPFFNDLIAYITRSSLCALILEGENAIARVRALNGNTNPKKAEGNTIRKIYGISLEENTVHSSDSKESAEREIKIWFS